MSWARLDDRANEHRKQLAAGAEACWLWACGLMYANRQPARDGFIPEQMLPMLYPMLPRQRAKLVAKLVEVELWHVVPGGYQIHEFTSWNKTKEQREEELASGRERAAKSYAARMAKKNDSSPEEVPKKNDSSGSTPTPLRLHSDSTPDDESVRASGVQKVAEPREPDPELRICPLNLTQVADSTGITRDFCERYAVAPEQIREAVREFTSYWTIGGGMGRKHANWPKKLREHLRKACEKPGALKAPGAIQHEETLSAEAAERVRKAAERGLAKLRAVQS